MSGFTTSALLKSLSNYPLTKGEAAGHPFRGNQWTTVGGITPEVANFITTNANKFYKAGGKVEIVKPGQKQLANGKSIADEKTRLYQESIALGNGLSNFPKGPERNALRRLRDGYEAATVALDGVIALEDGHRGGALIATDKDGNIVGAIDYYTRDSQMHIGFLGSTNEPDGIATALEAKLATVANGKDVASIALLDAKDYHLAIGRTLNNLGNSTWDANEVKAIASLPIGPEHL